MPLSLGHLSIVCLGLLLYVLTSRTHHARRSSGTAVAWVLLILAFPYLGIPIYLMFGMRKMTKLVQPALQRAEDEAVRQAMQEEGGDVRVTPGWAREVLAAIHAPPPVRADALHFEADGRVALLGVLEFIERAERELLVCTFILSNDELAERVMDALVVAAHRGVAVRLIIDAIGSLSLSKANMLRLERSGVALRRFMPILHNTVKGRANLRNHRKYMVADGYYVWSGGRNFAREYFLDEPRHPAWLDLSFQITGPIAEHYRAQFESDWQQASAPMLWGSRRVASETLAHSAIDAFYRLQETWHQVANLVLANVLGQGKADSAQPGRALMADAMPDQTVQLVATGPDHADDTIYTLVLTAIFQARRRIAIVTPYFVPDDALTAALTLAARRGLAVEILTPRRSNHRLADIARMRAMRDVAAAGAVIYAIDAMCHAKVVLIDEAMALCGSANLDTRSLFLNYEVMTAFFSPEAIDALTEWVDHVRAKATRYDMAPPGYARDLLEGMVRAIAFEL